MTTSAVQTKASLDELQGLLDISSQKAKDVAGHDTLLKMEALERQMVEASEIKDSAQRDLRTQILSTEMDTLRKDAGQEELDLAETVMGLNVFVEGLGAEYESLTKPNAEEQSLIGDAQAVVQAAESELVEAKTARLFRAGKIAQAEQKIAAAKTALAEANVEANKRMRKRLLNHSMENSLQEFQGRVAQTIVILRERMTAIEGQIRSVSSRREQTFAAKEAASEALEKAKAIIEQIEGAIFTAEQDLAELQSGTPEWTAKEGELAAIRSQFEDAKTARDVALGLFQSKEKFATELEIHEAALKKLRSNQMHWIKVLQSDTEERVVTFRSRLEAMKASSDQEIAQTLDQIGANVDQSNATYMARAAVASDRIMAKKVKDHPERYKRMVDTQAALAEHIRTSDEGMRDMVRQMTERYGIDPTTSRFTPE